MNLSQVRKLNTGDKIKFKIPFPSFTTEKYYKVERTTVGRIIKDDNNHKWFLNDRLSFAEYFELEEI